MTRVIRAALALAFLSCGGESPTFVDCDLPENILGPVRAGETYHGNPACYQAAREWGDHFDSVGLPFTSDLTVDDVKRDKVKP